MDITRNDETRDAVRLRAATSAYRQLLSNTMFFYFTLSCHCIMSN